MGVGIAEIDEHPIAHVPGHEAVEPGDRLRDALMIGADYRTQILWVERGRERGRANEVGEHHRQLATLGVVSPSWLDIHECRRCRYGSRDVAEIVDRMQHFQPVAERNAKVFEMLVGQVGENGHINVVLGEPLRVLGHAELFEPVRNLLHRGHRDPCVAHLSVGPTTTERDYTRKTAKARPHGRGIAIPRAEHQPSAILFMMT